MIPAEAVEAAGEAIRDLWDSGTPVTPQDEARAALEAAAPRMQAEVWEEGYCAGWYDRELAFVERRSPDEEVTFATPNPYAGGPVIFGLVGRNDEHLHDSRNLEWIKLRQADHPGSVVTVKRDGKWYDYQEPANHGE